MSLQVSFSKRKEIVFEVKLYYNVELGLDVFLGTSSSQKISQPQRADMALFYTPACDFPVCLFAIFLGKWLTRSPSH